MSNGDQVGRILGFALNRKPSVDFAGVITPARAPYSK